MADRRGGGKGGALTLPVVDILCDEGAAQAEVESLNRVLQEYGLPPASPTYARRSAGDLPWQLLVTGAPFVAFWTAIAAKAGDDAYGAMKRWLEQVWAARGNRPGNVTIIDEPSQTWVVLEPDLPDEALRQLGLLNPERDGGELGHLRWDPKRGAWVPPN